MQNSEGHASMVYKCIDKILLKRTKEKELIMMTEKYFKNYTKKLFKKFEKQKVHSCFL